MQSYFLGFELYLLKTLKEETMRLRHSARQYTQPTMATPNFTASFQAFLPTKKKINGKGEQDCGRDGSQGKDRWFGGGGKVRMFEKDEEGVEWCGPINLWYEEFLGEVISLSIYITFLQAPQEYS